MGMTHVDLHLKNPSKPDVSMVGEFLVDTGAQFTVLPGKVVRKLSLRPTRRQEFVLADGKVVSRNLGSCLVRYGEVEVPGLVVLGEDDDSPLLGAITLESMGLAVDPFKKKLYPLKMHL